MEAKTCNQKSCTKKINKITSLSCNVCTMVLKAQRKRAQANQKLLNHITSSRILSGSMKIFS